MIRAARHVLPAVAVVVGLAMPGSAPPASAAPVGKDRVEAFARLGDCAAPTEGVTCHFLSASARRRFVQLELTTVVVEDGRDVYLRDILCHIDRAKVKFKRKAQRIEFDGRVPTSACVFLPGEPEGAVDVHLTWTAAGPLSVGGNDCSVRATVDGHAPGRQLFCSILVTVQGDDDGSGGNL